jgi:hypothetical protein
MTLHELMVVALVKAVEPTLHDCNRQAYAMSAKMLQKHIVKKGPQYIVHITNPLDVHKIDIYA